MSTLVSIITPSLNSDKTIERTILSVLNQDYKSIQYIIVDGQSSDGTLEILAKYHKLDSRIVVVSEKDNSMTEALNRGLRLSKGEIIASLNADDWYNSGTINHVVDLYNKNKFECLMGNTQLVLEDGKLLYVTKPWLASCPLAWYLMGCLTPESSVFYSANCIETVGLFDESFKYTQDIEYYLRILSKYKIDYTNKIVSNFSVSTHQYSSRLRSQMDAEVLRFIKYKFLRKILGGTSLSTPLRILLGVRAYTVQELYTHTLKFVQNKF